MVDWCCMVHYSLNQLPIKHQPTFGVREVTPNLTLRTLDAALVKDAIEFMDSFEFARLIPVDECTTHAPGLCFDGDLLTFVRGANKP